MKINKLKKYIFICCFIIASNLLAQQDIQYTQYMYNTQVVNPAYAGSREALSVVGLHRSQWVGVPGAPQAQTLSIHSPLKNKQLGLGISIINDQLGPSQETYFNTDFSYTIPVSLKGKLSFGLKAGVRIFDVNFNRLLISGPSNGGVALDPSFLEPINNQIDPTVGFGVYYHTNRTYIGLSIPNLLETEHFDNISGIQVAKETINLYLILGHTFDLSNDLKFKPAILNKLVAGSPIGLDLSANFLLYDKLTLGASYRLNNAISGLLAFQISNTLLIGFGYDKETTEFGSTTFNDGSYELTLRFELFKNVNRIISPRFF